MNNISIDDKFGRLYFKLKDNPENSLRNYEILLKTFANLFKSINWYEFTGIYINQGGQIERKDGFHILRLSYYLNPYYNDRIPKSKKVTQKWKEFENKIISKFPDNFEFFKSEVPEMKNREVVYGYGPDIMELQFREFLHYSTLIGLELVHKDYELAKKLALKIRFNPNKSCRKYLRKPFMKYSKIFQNSLIDEKLKLLDWFDFGGWKHMWIDMILGCDESNLLINILPVLSWAERKLRIYNFINRRDSLIF